MVGIFYVLACRIEKSDFKLWISGIADPIMLWHSGRDADEADGVRIYWRIRATKIRLVQQRQDLQPSTPIRDSRHMPDGI